MISRLSGKLIGRNDNRLLVDVGGVGYEVLVPTAVANLLHGVQEGDDLSLVTLHYLQMDQSNRATPMLIGFMNEIQREFFEKLTTVPKVGPKLALNVFSLPMSQVAAAIERGDLFTLKSLPQVGAQKAKDMVATLQGKVSRYALMQDEVELPRLEVTDMVGEALQILLALDYKRFDAERMIEEALQSEPKPENAEQIVRRIYELKRPART